MAIKSINELTAMTTADLTANDVLVVGTSSGAKKIPAQDAFSGGGESNVTVYNATSSLSGTIVTISLGSNEDPVSPTSIISEFTAGKAIIITVAVDLTSFGMGTQYWQISVGSLVEDSGSYYMYGTAKMGALSPAPITFEASSASSNLVAEIDLDD